MAPTLKEWWQKYGQLAPATVDEVIWESMEGVVAFSPLIAVALGGISSGDPRFANQIGLLEDILNPTEWQRAGYVLRVQLPETGGYLYQALHGAMALHVGKVAVAMDLARAQTTNSKTGVRAPLWRRHDLVAWPESLGKNATSAWRTLLDLAARWDWVSSVFGDAESYQESLFAYYLALNLLEYVELLRSGHVPDAAKPMDYQLDVPPVFESAPDGVKRRGYRLLASPSSGVREWLLSTKVDVMLIQRHWADWIRVQAFWNAEVHPFATNELSNERLVSDILGD